MSKRKKFIEDNDLKMNNSTVFILPMLHLKGIYDLDELISAYISKTETTNLVDFIGPYIILCLVNSDTDKLKNTIYDFQQHKEFISIDYDDDNKEIVVTFSVPKEYIEDFNLIQIGRYSRISREYKNVLLDNHGRKTGAGKCIYMIDALMPCHETKKYRADKIGCSISDLPNGEVMSSPDDEDECYVKTSDLDIRKQEEGENGVE